MSLSSTKKSLVLDRVGFSSVIAFSLRLLSASCAQAPLIQVRRSSDNALRDIYARVDGGLDTADLLSFVGSGTGYVAIWYDQSGGGNHAAQSTATQQPIIVSSGVLQTLNNKPAIYCNIGTSAVGLAGNLQATGSYPVTLNAVGGVSAPSQSLFLVVGNYSSNGVGLGVGINVPPSLNYVGLKSGTAYMPTNVTLVANQSSVMTEIISTGTNTSQMYFNGVASTILSGSNISPNSMVASFKIAPITTNTYIQETICFYTQLTTDKRQTLEHDQEQYYSIPGN
jgi:Alpha-L-arabinofuranosidase B, catalytic